MIAAGQRISDRGECFDAELVREFIVAALGHDAAQDAVDEVIFDHVVAGLGNPAAVAASLRPIVDEILDVATREDWQVIADGLIADARELERATASGSRRRLGDLLRQIFLVRPTQVRQRLLGVWLIVEKVANKLQSMTGIIEHVSPGKHPDP